MTITFAPIPGVWKYHTIVLHTSPDLEACTMDAVARVPQISAAIGLRPNAARKFVSAGPLNKADWPDLAVVSAEAIEEAGNLAFDCCGGEFDSHGKPQNSKSCQDSSLDLFLQHLRELGIQLYSVIPDAVGYVLQRISDNDREGNSLATDNEKKKSETPHVERHLRNVVVGLNRLHPNDPDFVVELVQQAFLGICAHVEKVPPREQGKVNKYLLLDGLIEGVRMAFDEEIASDFADHARAGLMKLEQDWQAAESDYWSDNCYGQPVTPQGYRRQLVVVGYSDSPEFGRVARLGNVAPCDGKNAGKLRDPSRPERTKADIVVQIWSNGRFMVSSSNRGFKLNRVAAEVRLADLTLKGVDVQRSQQIALAESGHLRFMNNDGQDVEALYLTEFNTAFGDNFRSSPNSPKSALAPQAIVSIVLAAISKGEW